MGSGENTTEKYLQMLENMAQQYKQPNIKVVCVGGAGTHCGEYLYEQQLDNTQVILVNGDWESMKTKEANTKILLAKNVSEKLAGAGGHPEVGQHCLELGLYEVQDKLKNSDIIFVVAGLGGGFGSGALPSVAKLAKDNSSVVIGIEITPFDVESRNHVDTTVDQMEAICDVNIVLENQRLMEIAPEASISEAFNIMNKLVLGVVKEIKDRFSVDYFRVFKKDVASISKESEYQLQVELESTAEQKKEPVVQVEPISLVA